MAECICPVDSDRVTDFVKALRLGVPKVMISIEKNIIPTTLRINDVRLNDVFNSMVFLLIVKDDNIFSNTKIL